MPEKKYIGNRIVVVLSEVEKQTVGSIKQEATPSNKNIIALLLLILEAITEEE